ncbi:glycosyltransferase family 2 protein [candidate division WOR-3 bacterium]|nr:glycosyltransferase family 2 protein [candidate division WOR-3 bacterium]
MDLSKTAVVIPAYNAQKTLGTVIGQLTDYGFDKENIIVVNDGSEDKTGDVARNKGVTLIDLAQNRGKGAALKAGFALARKKNLPRALVIDADCQHDVSDIARFLERNGRYDITIGERQDILRRMPRERRLTNKTVNLVVSLLSGVRTTDVQCGLRYIDLKVFDKMEVKTDRYEMESEMVINAGRRKYRVGFVPVKSIYGHEQSYIHPLIDTMRFIGMAVRSLWR